MKKVLSIVLALTMVLGIVSFVSAEETRTPVTISIANSATNYPNTDNTPWWPDIQVVMDAIKTLVPGLEITIKADYYEDLNKQLPLLIASGDESDIMPFNKFEWMKYLDTGSFIEDLNPLVDQYAPKLREILTQKGFDLCTVGGQLKAIPCENFYYKYITWLRVDWLRKLGIEVKDTYTISELKDILYAFTTQDPDGNGKDDTYGLGTRFSRDASSWDISFMSIFGAFGGLPGQYYLNKETGEVSPFNYSDNMYEAMKWIHQLYADKVIDQEIFVLPYDQAMQNAINGKGGMYTGWWNDGENLIASGICDVAPECELKNVFITSDDGKYSGMLDNGMITKAIMISNKCEHPEAAIAVISLLQDQYQSDKVEQDIVYDGVNIVNYKIKDEDGNYLLWDDSLPATGGNIQRYWSRPGIDARKDEAFAKFGPDATWDDMYPYGLRSTPWENLASNMRGRIWNAEATIAQNEADAKARAEAGIEISPMLVKKAEYDKIGYEMQMNKENHPTYADFFYGIPQTEEYITYTPALDSLLKDWIVRFVTGELELNEENWQAYKDAAVAQGAQEVINSMVATYNGLNGTSYTAVSVNGK